MSSQIFSCIQHYDYTRIVSSPDAYSLYIHRRTWSSSTCYGPT